MRINKDKQSIDIEERDIAYFLSAYVRQYEFYTRGELPKEIVFPMFESVVYRQGVGTPIRFIPVASPEAADIIEDGSNIPITSEKQLAALDEKDEEIKKLKQQVEELLAQPDNAYEPTEPEIEAEALEDEAADLHLEADTAPLPDDEPHWPSSRPVDEPEVFTLPDEPDGVNAITRAADDAVVTKVKLPEHPATGQPDNMHPRDRNDLLKAQKDLQVEPDLDETKEKPFDKEVKRNAAGEPEIE